MSNTKNNKFNNRNINNKIIPKKEINNKNIFKTNYLNNTFNIIQYDKYKSVFDTIGEKEIIKNRIKGNQDKKKYF